MLIEPPLPLLQSGSGGAGVASGTLWNALTLVLGLPLAILSFSLISHALGPNLMGRYNFLVWLNAAIVGLLIGTANAATKYVAELRGKGQNAQAAGVVRWLVGLQGLVGLGLVGLAVLASLLWQPAFWLEYLLPTGAAAISLVGGVLVGVAQAERRFRALAFNNIAFALFQFGLVVLTLTLGWQVEGLLWILFASSLLYFGLNWFLVWRTGLLTWGRAPKLPPTLRHEILGYLGSVAGAFALSVVVWQDSEVFFLKIFSNAAEISYYSAAFVLASRLILLPDLVFAAFLPVVCSLYARADFVQLGLLHRQTLRYLLLLSTPIAVGGIVLAGPIVQLFNGPGFAPAAAPLALLLLSGLLIAPGKLAVAILMAANDRHFILNLTILAACLNLALAAGFVAMGWGATGAAWASVLAQLGVVITIGRAAKLSHQTFPWLIFAKNIGAAGLAFGGAAFLVQTIDWPHFIIAGLVGTLIYLVLLPLLGLVGWEDWRQISHRWGRH